MAFVPRSREKDQDHWDIDRWENDGGSSIGGKGGIFVSLKIVETFFIAVRMN
ncbi:hypothetical protein [Lysinibacillus fusiformis]|uniref:hypothetical protein n=1 Tax=Lysinibacillus fusiformis TaxID=28031 RepID=UPI0037F86477